MLRGVPRLLFRQAGSFTRLQVFSRERTGHVPGFLKNSTPADPSGLTFCDPGDTIAFVSAGGGGYGDPFERDPKAVERDVQYGYVSIEKAKQDYAVIIDPDNLTLDCQATLQCREQIKANHKL